MSGVREMNEAVSVLKILPSVFTFDSVVGLGDARTLGEGKKRGYTAR